MHAYYCDLCLMEYSDHLCLKLGRLARLLRLGILLKVATFHLDQVKHQYRLISLSMLYRGAWHAE